MKKLQKFIAVKVEESVSETMMEDSHNESTDSFFNSSTPSVVSLRQENPNLQTIDEQSIKRANTLHKVQQRQTHTVDASSSKRTSRYSFSPSQLTPSTSEVTGDIDKLTKTMRVQNFWKYHIISIGKNQMYMTTNPDIKHLYCRNGPGYFVQLVLPKIPASSRSHWKRQSDIGFRLIFKRQIYDEVDNEDNLKDPKECIVVTKSSKEEGGNFSVVACMMNGLNGLEKENPVTLKNTAYEKPIEELLALLQKDPHNLELQKLIPSFHRYESDINGEKYLIGSNPIAKQKTSHRLKINHESIFKLTGKQNVYFYSKGEAEKSLPRQSKRHSFVKSFRSEVRSVQDEDKIFALFRPHEKRFKKKIIKTLNSSSGESAPDIKVEDYNYIENNQYYKPGDGLNQLNPKDDSPNENKIGWITIFEYLETLELWEIVLGYTFAVGFDRIIDDYVRE